MVNFLQRLLLQRTARRRRLSNCQTLAGTAVLMIAWGAAPAVHAQSIEFEVDDIDLGSIDRIGDLNWSHTLGTTWDENFSLGGFVGKRDAQITPEVTAAGKVIIPRTTGDTRTGAKFSGNVSGGTGLNFYADFQASGLMPGSAFDFRPAVELPNNVTSGEFFRLSTNTGMQSNPGYDQHAVDLPSFEAGMDFFFDLELQSRVEGAVFPVVDYQSTEFNPAPINVNQNLLKFAFDLDPSSNPDSAAGTPPTFTIFEDTPFESSVGFLDDSESVADKQISVDVKVKDQPGVTRRLDIGEVQLVNPFGVGESGLGGEEPNLTVSTSSTESGLGYSFETPLLRMGLDLDGIAAFLGTGESFTRLEEDLGGLADITADLIDIKYGPEIGYRESVDIQTDFEVTLEFDQTIAMRNGDGVELVNSFTGLWSDLPELSLLGEDPVEVTASFDALTAELSKRGAMFLTDYLELTLLELESVEILDTVDLSLPPLLRERASLLGALLGEFELEVLNQTLAIDPIVLEGIGSSFTLEAATSPRVYRAADAATEDPTDLSGWRTLTDHSEPDALADKVLVIGQSEEAVDHVGELAPTTFAETGFESGETVTLADLFEEQSGEDRSQITPTTPVAPNTEYTRFKPAVEVRGIEVLAGSELASGRRWKLGSIRNDGLIHNEDRDHLTFLAANDLLQITGEGTLDFRAPGSVVAPTLFHGQGHTLRFTDVAFALEETANLVRVNYYLGSTGVISLPHFVEAPELVAHDRLLDVSQTLNNAGRIVFDNSDATIALSDGFTNQSTGTLEVINGSRVVLDSLQLEQDGLFAARGADAQLVFQSTVLAPAGVDGVFEAGDGGTVQFRGSSTIGELTRPDTSGTAPPLKRQTFRAAEGGRIAFDETFEQRYDVQSRFEVDPGGELVLNGIEFAPLSNISQSSFDRFAAIASDFIDITNHGTLTVASGENLLFITPPGSLAPGSPAPEPQPVVTPLNLVNTGEVVIESGASFGFEVEIENYAEGGAVFDQGKWTLTGATPTLDFSNTTDIDDAPAGAAVLDLRVVQVSNDDSYIGTVFFGEGNDIQDFDTQLAVNASDITLSGQALFPYLNTMEENRGSLTLLNRNRFHTAGDLLNTGEIRLEGGSHLIGAGDLTVDEGSIVVDATSGFGAGTIEVIGGSIMVDHEPEPIFNQSSWIVREKWVGEDAEGNDIILPATVSYGDAYFPFIDTQVDITVDGEQAFFEPLAGVEQNFGSLTLSGGTTLQLDRLGNDGRVEINSAAQLTIDGELMSRGELIVGPEGYLQTAALRLEGGSAVLNGVVDTPEITIAEGVAVSGSTRIAGALRNDGLLMIGSSPGLIEVFGDTQQTSSGTLAFELFGQVAGESYDQLIVHGDGTFEGDLSLIFGESFQPSNEREWLLVDMREALDTELPGVAEWLFEEIHVAGLDVFTGDFDAASQMRHADDLLLGAYNDHALFLTFEGGQGSDLMLYSVIPEPGSALLLAAGLLVLARRRRMRPSHAPVA
ncbi:MAG: hypothetical protein WD294_04780 [Phycisphaeraceae bacterium]